MKGAKKVGNVKSSERLLTCLPSFLLAAAVVILRVTKVLPRRGDS